MYDHVVQSLFGIPGSEKLMKEVFVDAGFLVAAYNSRGAGQSGGNSRASAQTQMEDYESIVERLLQYAEDARSAVDQLYICVCPLLSFLKAGILYTVISTI